MPGVTISKLGDVHTRWFNTHVTQFILSLYNPQVDLAGKWLLGCLEEWGTKDSERMIASKMTLNL